MRDKEGKDLLVDFLLVAYYIEKLSNTLYYKGYTIGILVVCYI